MRKRKETVKKLKKRYQASRREERTLIVEKLRRVAPWLTEEDIGSKAKAQ
jgi:hypothetical protein